MLTKIHPQFLEIVSRNICSNITSSVPENAAFYLQEINFGKLTSSHKEHFLSYDFAWLIKLYMNALSPRKEKYPKSVCLFQLFCSPRDKWVFLILFSVWHQIKWQENSRPDQAGGRSTEFLCITWNFPVAWLCVCSCANVRHTTENNVHWMQSI